MGTGYYDTIDDSKSVTVKYNFTEHFRSKIAKLNSQYHVLRSDLKVDACAGLIARVGQRKLRSRVQFPPGVPTLFWLI